MGNGFDAYYDSTLNLTWIADADLPGRQPDIESFNVNGKFRDECLNEHGCRSLK